MFEIGHNDCGGQTDLDALRELLLEAVEQVKPPRTVIYRSNIATMSCGELVEKIIALRGTRRAAYLATRLDQALAARGKRRALLHYAAHNGTGAHVHD
jgi:hypothetical protein